MKTLRRRLKKAGILDARLRAEINALERHGTACITNPALRSAVEEFLCVVPLAFFTDTASRSGRLHPPWQCGRHGTLRSIVESCVLLPGWARHVPDILDANKNPDPRAVELAMAATIVSDTWKKEDAGDVHYGAQHGRVAAEHWLPFALARGVDRDVAESVAEASVWHMGVYARRSGRSARTSPRSRGS